MMTPEQFEDEVAQRFPALKGDVAEDRGLLHVVMGDLYRYTQEHISAESWAEVDRIFRFLEKAYGASLPRTEIENAVRVSFLEYFDFQTHEERIRVLLGPQLTALYEDQMQYMADLARRAAELGAPPNGGPAASSGSSGAGKGPPSVS
jgi:hypothetical protein